MRSLIVFFFFLICYGSFGQNQEKIDALLSEIKNSTEDSLKVDLLNKVFYQYRPYDLDKAKIYIDSALQLAFKAKYQKGITHSSINNSSVDAAKGNNEKAVKTLKKGLQKVKEYHYSKGIVNLNVWLSNTYLSQNNFEEAKACLDEAIIEGKKANFKTGLSNAYTNYGNFYIVQSDYINAVKYYTKVDSICTKYNYSGSSCSVAIINIGSIKSTLEEYDDALFYFNKAEKMIEGKQSEIRTLQQIKLLKGIVEYRRENYINSISYLEEALNYFDKTKRIPKKIEALNFLGPSYRKSKQYNLAEKALKEAAELSLNIDKKLSLSDSYTELGVLYTELKNYKKAINYFEKGKVIATELDVIATLESASKGLSEAYFLNSNFKAAAKEYKEYIVIQDSLYTLRNKEVTLDIETKYQTQKKEREIALLKSQNELAKQQKKNQQILFLSGLGFTTLASLFFFFQFRNRKKINKKLKELDNVKSNFFTNISHEFRTPLTLILGPIQKQLKKEDLDEEDRNNLKMMQRNSNRLLSLVDQLLDISKIESGKLTLKVSKSKIIPFIQTLVEGFSFSAKQKQITFTTNINTDNIDTWFDSDAVEKIITNLLSNAIKYTPKKGEISCTSFVENNQLHFEIINSGKVLSNEELSKVFERFYKNNENQQQGAGIGLSLVKDIVKLHKGTISVKSLDNKWTVFKVMLPVSKTHFKEKEIIDYEINTLPKQQGFENTFETDEIKETENNLKTEKPILLIVEDNAEVRTYISSMFKNTYTILQAQNGQEGIDMAFKYIPDFIMSDIMMPVKNGIELCNELKTDECTSHIPIILLTAKTGEENEIEGIKTGADDYITKPFNEDLLKLKVDKLLETRKKLREHYSKDIIFKPKDIAVNSTDEVFLQRVKTVLDNNLIESSFNIEEFSNTVGMSRMQLHRKLKALTGLSASEFIRSQRLKLAAQLLKKSDANVSQIGYSVGFNNPGYFSKCFKEMYKLTPLEYSKKQH
jgi:signal transduction histidine kinase/DNA-binding response OmpR family regulator